MWLDEAAGAAGADAALCWEASMCCSSSSSSLDCESWVTIGIILWMSGSPGLFPGLLLQTWNWGKDRRYEAGSCEGVDSGERNDVLVADRVTDLGKLALECQPSD